MKAEISQLYIFADVPSNVQPNYLTCDHPITYDEQNPGMAFGCYLHIENTGGESYCIKR